MGEGELLKFPTLIIQRYQPIFCHCLAGRGHRPRQPHTCPTTPLRAYVGIHPGARTTALHKGGISKPRWHRPPVEKNIPGNPKRSVGRLVASSTRTAMSSSLMPMGEQHDADRVVSPLEPPHDTRSLPSETFP